MFNEIVSKVATRKNTRNSVIAGHVTPCVVDNLVVTHGHSKIYH